MILKSINKDKCPPSSNANHKPMPLSTPNNRIKLT